MANNANPPSDGPKIFGTESTPAADSARIGKKPKRSGRLSVDHGSASVKSYPVASMELWGLGALGLVASLAFSAAAALVTFSIDTQKDLDLAVGVDAAVIAYWKAAEHFAFWAGIGVGLFGLGVVAGGSLYILHIMRRTKFSGE